MTLQYRIKTASREQIYSHLKECDGHFIPPLSSRVDLLDYSMKMSKQSVSFEAWQDHILVGMINVYLNDASAKTGFITNVTTLKEYRGKGVAAVLLQMCLEHARDHGFNRIKLEVSRPNRAAIKLYSRAGFLVIEECGENLLMEREISGPSDQ